MRTIWLLPGWFGFVVGPLPSGQVSVKNTHKQTVPFLRKVAHMLTKWEARTRQRRDLAEMDTRMLKDIGLNQYDVHHEVSKHFWQE